MWFGAGSFSFSQNADRGHEPKRIFKVMKNPQEMRGVTGVQDDMDVTQDSKEIVVNQNSGYNYPIRRGGDVAILDAAVLRVL